jgi:predicted phosphoribosyltransferase
MFRINADGSRRQIAGLLLADTVLPDELENSSSELTPARELFDLMKEACLGKLNNIMIRADGTATPINGAAYNVALRMQSSPKTAEIVVALVDQFPWMRNQHTKRLIRSAVQILKASRQPVAASTIDDGRHRHQHPPERLNRRSN